MQRLFYIFISKASRASVSSLLSILTPIYLTRLGYSALYVGVALTTILAGNAFFNIILTWYGDYLGRRRSLLVFSLLVVVSGVLLSSTIFLPLILLGLFLGNFFFSSRRRHTISVSAFLLNRSSDLHSFPKHLFQGYLNIYNNYFKAPWMRSEERRVGKECRSQGTPYDYKKNRGRIGGPALVHYLLAPDTVGSVSWQHQHDFM